MQKSPIERTVLCACVVVKKMGENTVAMLALSEYLIYEGSPGCAVTDTYKFNSYIVLPQRGKKNILLSLEQKKKGFQNRATSMRLRKKNTLEDHRL